MPFLARLNDSRIPIVDLHRVDGDFNATFQLVKIFRKVRRCIHSVCFMCPIRKTSQKPLSGCTASWFSRTYYETLSNSFHIFVWVVGRTDNFFLYKSNWFLVSFYVIFGRSHLFWRFNVGPLLKIVLNNNGRLVFFQAEHTKCLYLLSVGNSTKIDWSEPFRSGTHQRNLLVVDSFR